jgi:uncharacterized metal-binding protein
MPSGKIHALSTVIAAGITVPLLVASAGQSWGHAAAFAVGCLANLLVNPDLDVPSGSRAYVIMRRTGGTLLGKLWQLFWYPYACWLIPHHRHPLSHLPILGTLIRLVYLLGVPALAWWVVGHFVPLPSLPRLAITLELQWAVMGLIFADTLHTLMDWMVKD